MPHRGEYRCALALAALLMPLAASAEVENELSPLVVSAMRIPQPASSVTASVTVLDPQDLQDRGLLQFREALNETPGVIATSTAGQTGAAASLFIRGTTTAYSQMVVDGMRLGDSSSQLGNFFSASRVYDVGRLEILRGAQGAIYGGESVGGVLWMETPHGTGKPHGSVTAEGGSFGSFSINALHQGDVGPLSYFLSGGYEQTANDAPNHDFHQLQTALRVEAKLDKVWTLGTTYRGYDNFYQNGATSDDRVNEALATVYATGVISDHWTTRFNAGLQQESYDSNSHPGTYGNDMQAAAVSTDQRIVITDELLLLATAFYHHNTYQSASADNWSNTRTDNSSNRYGAGAALEWTPITALTTSAALRWEDYDAYGSQLTWRVGSVYQLTKTGTTLRGGVGTSFRTPTYLDLYGSTYADANPNLVAENALGWDLGIVQKLSEHHQLELTGFRNQIQDQIKSIVLPSWQYQSVNLPGNTTTDGLEAGLSGAWLEHTINYRAAWTLLGKSLLNQPRNAASASIDWKPTTQSMIGVGVSHLSEHSWGGAPIAAYTLARVYGSYQLTDTIKLHARVENLFNENYELSNPSAAWGGTPVKGAGTGLYAGLTFDW
ncbi:MAG: TonB-dependent receptor [Verrucomicrobiota bacterium]